ncbi:PREDICTED: GTP-binding protein REM 2 [Colobus angolensis palliatus]|uniref:GTP-binding protein REM 2 n=1 Tax=Colobus angolensis palliatus TaxID=336983 RepID=UPI0005F40B92|nr:PREDICTED: GTP-binding protein REM 2 [Colobus angolensis palliatus]
MHTDPDTDMDMDTETTALCPSGSRRASPPGTPTPEADTTLLKKPEKLLAELDRSGLPSVPGAPRRRGSMPVPYKHQLRRAQAVDELDWPPQASSSGSSDSLGSGEAAPAQKDGIFKVMLVGESGVGKSTLAGTFGGLQGDSAHEPENPEDTYERRIMVDKEEVTLVVYDIWEQVRTKMWLQAGCPGVTAEGGPGPLGGTSTPAPTRSPDLRASGRLEGKDADLTAAESLKGKDMETLPPGTFLKTFWFSSAAACVHFAFKEFLKGSTAPAVTCKARVSTETVTASPGDAHACCCLSHEFEQREQRQQLPSPPLDIQYSYLST